MALFQSQNHKHTQKRLKKRLTQDQVRLLESSFSHDMKLEPERKFQLARELGLQPRQVAIWYQNRKARWKTQTLELDYNTLHVRLDSVLADKKRLEREVLRLRAELQKAQEMLIGLNSNVLSSSSMSTYAEENRTSGLPGDRNCAWENAGALQVDELYACLMGSEAQTRQTARLNSQNLVA